jgi:anti-sigma regulatory factor (Ser/Thr protein kinase)
VDNALSEDPPIPPIEVLSANKHWVELLVPCERSVVSRVQSFLSRLETDLPAEVMEKVGYAFRELLNNAIEWGGHLDPNLKVRISYIRTRKLLMFRLDDPGPGFKLEDLKHAAVSNPVDDPIGRRIGLQRSSERSRPDQISLRTPTSCPSPNPSWQHQTKLERNLALIAGLPLRKGVMCPPNALSEQRNSRTGATAPGQ